MALVACPRGASADIVFATFAARVRTAMNTQSRFISIAGVGLLLASTSVTLFAAAEPPFLTVGQGQRDACTLLGAADASTALEVSSQPGKRPYESNPLMCAWSADPKLSDSSRRVVAVIVTPKQFQIASRPAISTIKVEPVSGIGDEAFYQLYPNASPFIWVRKGTSALTIRILTRQKPSPPFTVDQEKAKIAVLAKAAIAKL
jgi:hypothetical protein